MTASGSYLIPAFQHARVADAMRPGVISCPRTPPLRAHGVSHVMVVDPEHNQPLGVVSTLDIAGIVAWGRA